LLLNDTLTTRTCLVCLLAVLSWPAHAIGFSMGNGSSRETVNYTTNRPWGNLGAVTPAPQYQPPQPMLPGYSYYPGASPDTGWYTPAYPAANVAPAATAPTAEVQVSDTRFYEQQHGIYTVRIVSSGNIATLDRELPDIDGAVMEPIDGPITTTRTDGNPRNQEIVNTYRFRLTPLRSGEVTIPPIRFTGTLSNRQTGRQGSAFTVASQPLTLQVREADASVQPWLPLHDLSLQTQLQPEGPMKAGQPVTLTVELKARGAQGNQLPSLANQIQGAGFRVYRDATSIKNGVSADDRYLTGSRTETYTLIPLQDGWLHLPNLHVAWWDVDLQEAALAGIPGDTAAGGHALAAAGGAGNSQFTPWFWAPMVIAMTLIFGYVLGAWNRSHRWLQLAGTRLGASTRLLAGRGGAFVSRLSPRPLLLRLRPAIAWLMPKPMRIWLCTRCLATEADPHTWCAEFKSRVCQHLDITRHAPLTRIAEELIARSPRVEPVRLRELAQSMDAAIYGGDPIDFGAWKRELQQLLRPRLASRMRQRVRRNDNQLPALNPLAA
jgi:hypothetical protein